MKPDWEDNAGSGRHGQWNPFSMWPTLSFEETCPFLGVQLHMIWTRTCLRGRWLTWSLGLSDPSSAFSLWSHLFLTSCYCYNSFKKRPQFNPTVNYQRTFWHHFLHFRFWQVSLEFVFEVCVLVPKGMRELPMTHSHPRTLLREPSKWQDGVQSGLYCVRC